MRLSYEGQTPKKGQRVRHIPTGRTGVALCIDSTLADWLWRVKEDDTGDRFVASVDDLEEATAP